MCDESGVAHHLRANDVLLSFHPPLELLAGVLYEVEPETGRVWRMLHDGPFLLSVGTKVTTGEQ
jgi:hypothetical protein